MLRFMGSQRGRHNWVTEQQQDTCSNSSHHIHILTGRTREREKERKGKKKEGWREESGSYMEGRKGLEGFSLVQFSRSVMSHSL